jgi:hypothetical protein
VLDHGEAPPDPAGVGRGPSAHQPLRRSDARSTQVNDAATAAAYAIRRGTVADTYNGYCVKCKEKRDFEGRIEVSKTGMKMAKGTCPVCGTTVNRILGKA